VGKEKLWKNYPNFREPMAYVSAFAAGEVMDAQIWMWATFLGMGPKIE
jgi:hypothetical protein